MDAIRAFKRMLQIAWSENDHIMETKAYEYLALQYFYLQQLDKAQVYKLKAFHGDIEGPESDCRRSAIKARFNYKQRIASDMGVKQMVRVKKQRQHKRVDRTAISKISTKTNTIDNYYVIKTQIKEIE